MIAVTVPSQWHVHVRKDLSWLPDHTSCPSVKPNNHCNQLASENKERSTSLVTATLRYANGYKISKLAVLSQTYSCCVQSQKAADTLCVAIKRKLYEAMGKVVQTGQHSTIPKQNANLNPAMPRYSPSMLSQRCIKTNNSRNRVTQEA